MKVLHINTTDSGGAAWCAMRISKALSSQGVECRFLIAEGSPQENVIVAKRDEEFWYSNYFLGKVKHLLMRTPFFWDKEKMDKVLKEKNTQLEKPLFIHGPFSYYKNIINHPLFEWADIIHLHWVPEFIDYPSFFRKVNKPIVWTLHDKYPVLGIMHYCSEFFPVPDSLKSIDRFCMKIKRRGIKKTKRLSLVAISEQMFDICIESEVLRGLPVYLIHNGVDINVFHQYGKETCREELGLPKNAIVFLFSAYYIFDPNKGLDRVVYALNKLKEVDKILVCIGNNYPLEKPPKADFPLKMVGVQNDCLRIAKYYSAADFFVQGSYEETFAQTPLEAMACGTPVISTPCSGAKDLIRDFNGVICNAYNSDAIEEGIRKAVNTQYDSDAICQHVVENYQYSKIAQKYKELYESILKG